MKWRWMRVWPDGTCAEIAWHMADAMARPSSGVPPAKVAVNWPTGKSGSPIVVTAVAMRREWRTTDRSRRLIDWLISPEGQSAWAATSLAFPVNPAVPAAPALAALGHVKPDLATLQASVAALVEAARLSNAIGYR